MLSEMKTINSSVMGSLVLSSCLSISSNKEIENHLLSSMMPTVIPDLRELEMERRISNFILKNVSSPLPCRDNLKNAIQFESTSADCKG